MKIAKIIRRFAGLATMAGIAVMTSGCQSIAVFDPKGPIGAQQRDLIYFTMLLCLVVMVPVLLLAAWIVWRYRDKKDNKASYQPKWEHSTKLETIWWGIPIVVIAVLAIVTARYTYNLDPAKPLESEVKPITIQVTSLDWKWLFQYPEQGIATVNYLVIPEDTPIKFELTSDGPMNSFWVPQLGGMIYTMSGMSTTLHLQADEPGEFMGSGANFSGREFAKMSFTVKSVSQDDFDQWEKQAAASGNALTEDGYQKLAKPGTSGQVTYASIPEGLFHRIVHDYSMNRGAPAGMGQKARTLSDEHALGTDGEPSTEEKPSTDSKSPTDENPQNNHSDHDMSGMDMNE
ncbi:ubiquinol oxidase subunit II [Paenibacillus lignilyticus]|uniref:Quinol oxidase subunit 2 n=1 Tax=Paenibacillus lignilyticus TaxID=1172615 RepID=A0ABS5C867_9BACL|nr:ubiquinol oxidase subunit II [Paenibacillus lignilyticus]MBP3962177.1 ubiquinol oxidase subunit II [Paenibacillus lignilyticus]